MGRNWPRGGGLGKFKGRSWPPLRILFFLFFISVEQLSLNVAGDSAKTLSVLGNMGGVLDDCGLRFVHKWRRPLKIPPILGVQKRPKINLEKSRACSPNEIIPNR